MKNNMLSKNTIIVILILLATFIIPNFIAYKLDLKRIEEQRIREGMGFFGPDIINMFPNIGGLIASIFNSIFAVMKYVLGILNQVTTILSKIAGFARGLIQIVTNFFAGLGVVMQAVIAAFAIATLAILIDTFVTQITNWATGVANHIECGAAEFGKGWVNTFKTLGIMFECSWKMLINFFNGNCTRYYITDLVIGLTYGVFVQLPLILINAIFGLNLQPIVEFFYKLIVVPLDAILFAISGFHLVNWPDSVINDCYRCKATWTIPTYQVKRNEDGSIQYHNNGNVRKKVVDKPVTLYKPMNEWAQLFDCSAEQIIHGFLKVFTSIVPNAKWGAWGDGEHLPGWDDEPSFLGI
jgi:hypothetical protein